jgi:hypothetical protein
MDFEEFVSWLTRELCQNTFADYSSYKMAAKNPSTQEWSTLVKQLDQSPVKKEFVKVRKGSKKQIAFSNISRLENLEIQQQKGLLIIEWAGTRKVSQDLSLKRTARRDVLLDTIDEMRAQLSQFTALNLVSRVARLEKSVLGETMAHNETEGVYEVVSLLLPYLLEEGEDISIDTIVDRVGALRNFHPHDGRNTIDRLSIEKVILELARNRSEVFRIQDRGNDSISASRVSAYRGDNLTMLRLYPKQGLYYNLHYLGEGRSPVTNRLVVAMREEFAKISRIVKSLKLRANVTPQMIFTVACGIANPKWYFAEKTNEIIVSVNMQLAPLGYQLVESRGLWFLSECFRENTISPIRTY